MSLEIKITHYGTQRADQFNANPLNPRIHPQHQRDVIRASLQRFGIISPVVVSKRSGYLIDGHERVWQALAEGDDTLVPYVEADVEEDKEAELILTYDKSTMLAEYDPVNLQALMEQVNTDDNVQRCKTSGWSIVTTPRPLAQGGAIPTHPLPKILEN